MGAAFKRLLRESQARQPGTNGGDVLWPAVMGSACKRQFHIAQIERLGRTTFYDVDRLNRLDRRTRIHQPTRITDGEHSLTIRPHDGYGAAVTALHHIAACHFNQNGIHAHKEGLDTQKRMKQSFAQR